MTKREIAEAINKLKFITTKEILLKNEIVINWSLKIPFNRKQISLSKVKAFINVNSLEDKEEAIKSVELFTKAILINSSEKFQKMIREKNK